MISKIYFLVIILLLFNRGQNFLNAQSRDNGNGTFSNPVLYADFPDPDVIRVGDMYYMVSTSMHYFPGVTVMESSDLVNWTIAANAIESFDVHPYYNLDGGNRYAKGQWATGIRYFNDQFYLLFTTLTEGSFMVTAKDPHGSWILHKLETFLYDPGLFVDIDGRIYVIHGNTNIALTELNADGLSVKKDYGLIYQAHRSGLEGNRCYHIGDYYYIYCTYGGPQGSQICLRSKSLTGPFQEREVMHDMANYAPNVIHQGCLIDLPNGEYWSMIFQDHGGLGRMPFLVPTTWIDNWPMLGNSMNGIVRLQKPILGGKIIDFPTTDEFDSEKLGLQWQFNHNPDKTKYSLNERTGFLRMKTATVTDSILNARNTICQRIFGAHSEAVLKMDISKMKVGDRAGLMILQEPNATLTIEKKTKGYELKMTVSEEIKESKLIKADVIYLKTLVNGISDKVSLYYSLDNDKFLLIGEELKMEFRLSIFCGNRYAIFNYATKKFGGYVDIDWFRVKQNKLIDRKEFAGKLIEAEYFDYNYYAKVRLSGQDKEARNQDVLFKDGGQIAFCDISFSDKVVDNVELNLVCTSPDAKLEVRDAETGKILGRFDIPANSGSYQNVTFRLDEQLVPTDRIEIIVRKPRKEGIVALDNFTFKN